MLLMTYWYFLASGIESLLHNFQIFNKIIPELRFGAITKKAVEDKGLNVDVYAPTPKYPSMSMALDNYILKAIKKNKYYLTFGAPDKISLSALSKIFKIVNKSWDNIYAFL